MNSSYVHASPNHEESPQGSEEEKDETRPWLHPPVPRGLASYGTTTLHLLKCHRIGVQPRSTRMFKEPVQRRENAAGGPFQHPD